MLKVILSVAVDLLGDRIVKRLLILLHLQHVVSLLVDDLLSGLFLTVHRISRHHSPFQIENV